MRIPKSHEAAALIEELESLAACSPGSQPDVLQASRAIIAKWQAHRDAGIRSSADATMRALEDWFGADSQWDRSRDGGKHAHAVLVSSLKRLQDAITAAAWNI